ncbi:MAG TPA: hypothetical protein VMG30_01210 [Acidobacteriota bacterium]|nr:hypothetical protein [Acidobacteriota bacterium]
MRIFALPALVFCLISSTARSDEKLDTRNHTLKNIRGCEVVIERLNDASAALGLTEQQLKADVEQKLRAAGMEVDSKYSPMLAVTVTVLLDKSKTGVVFGYSAYVQVEFWQSVTIEANGLKDFAVTWKRGLIIGDQNNSLGKEQIRSTVRNLIDRFIKACLEANSQPLPAFPANRRK